MKAFPLKCATCRERAVSQTVLPSYSAEVEHDGRKYSVTLTELDVLRCDNCGTIVLDDDADEKLSDALRSAAGLLSPAEIRRKRDELGLTQKVLSGLMGIADTTLSRWETGAQIQQRSMDKFLRCFFNLADVRRFLGAPKTTWVCIPDRSILVVPLPITPLTPVVDLTSWSGGKTSASSPINVSTVTSGSNNPRGLAA